MHTVVLVIIHCDRCEYVNTLMTTALYVVPATSPLNHNRLRLLVWRLYCHGDYCSLCCHKMELVVQLHPALSALHKTLLHMCVGGAAKPLYLLVYVSVAKHFCAGAAPHSINVAGGARRIIVHGTLIWCCSGLSGVACTLVLASDCMA